MVCVKLALGVLHLLAQDWRQLSGALPPCGLVGLEGGSVAPRAHGGREAPGLSCSSAATGGRSYQRDVDDSSPCFSTGRTALRTPPSCRG